MRILAIDPAIRNTGYAVVEGDYRRARALDYGTLTIPRSVSQSGCLLAIKQHLGNLIDKWNPDEMAVERIIYVQSHQTAITMGAAKAAVVIAAAEAGLRIMEYSPKSVKLSVVGRGAAQKTQVAFMVRALLELRETPESDAADALAMALALQPDGALELLERPMVVELDGRHTRGATVVDWNRQDGGADNVAILMRYDQARFEAMIEAALAAA